MELSKTIKATEDEEQSPQLETFLKQTFHNIVIVKHIFDRLDAVDIKMARLSNTLWTNHAVTESLMSKSNFNINRYICYFDINHDTVDENLLKSVVMTMTTGIDQPSVEWSEVNQFFDQYGTNVKSLRFVFTLGYSLYDNTNLITLIQDNLPNLDSIEIVSTQQSQFLRIWDVLGDEVSDENNATLINRILKIRSLKVKALEQGNAAALQVLINIILCKSPDLEKLEISGLIYPSTTAISTDETTTTTTLQKLNTIIIRVPARLHFEIQYLARLVNHAFLKLKTLHLEHDSNTPTNVINYMGDRTLPNLQTFILKSFTFFKINKIYPVLQNLPNLTTLLLENNHHHTSELANSFFQSYSEQMRLKNQHKYEKLTTLTIGDIDSVTLVNQLHLMFPNLIRLELTFGNWMKSSNTKVKAVIGSIRHLTYLKYLSITLHLKILLHDFCVILLQHQPLLQQIRTLTVKFTVSRPEDHDDDDLVPGASTQDSEDDEDEDHHQLYVMNKFDRVVREVFLLTDHMQFVDIFNVAMLVKDALEMEEFIRRNRLPIHFK